MTALRHPNIAPPLVIEVEDVRVPEFVSAGWVLDSEAPDPDPATGPDSPEEEK